MATEPKIPTSIDAIDAEMLKTQERLATLAAAKQRAIDEQRDMGRPVLLAALTKVKIGDHSRAEAKVIAQALEKLGPARVADLLGAA